jgi:hypothetical protein
MEWNGIFPKMYSIQSVMNKKYTSGLLQYSLKRDGLLIQSSPTPVVVSVPSSMMILAW